MPMGTALLRTSYTFGILTSWMWLSPTYLLRTEAVAMTSLRSLAMKMFSLFKAFSCLIAGGPSCGKDEICRRVTSHQDGMEAIRVRLSSWAFMSTLQNYD